MAELVDDARVRASLADLQLVYAEAFGAAPYFSDGEDARLWREVFETRHIPRAGFRCALARAEDRIVGFGYGFTGALGQWWTDRVAALVPVETAKAWLGGHFELVELAVLPEFQGRGFGGALHDTLLDGLPHGRALLSTWRGDTPALALYLRRGWQVLHDDLDGESSLLGRRLAPA